MRTCRAKAFALLRNAWPSATLLGTDTAARRICPPNSNRSLAGSRPATSYAATTRSIPACQVSRSRKLRMVRSAMVITFCNGCTQRSLQFLQRIGATRCQECAHCRDRNERSAFGAELPSSRATELRSDRTPERPSDRTTEPPSFGPPNSRTTEPPNSRTTDGPTDRPNPRASEPPNSRTTEPPNSRTTEPPNSRTPDRPS
jgi:hypothetical protein